MDSKIPTSFIPKDSLRQDGTKFKGGTDLLMVGALLVLTGAVVYLAGAYTYRYLVYNEINRPCAVAGANTSCGLRASLEIETRELERDRLEHLKRLDIKLKNGLSVLSRHTTLVPLFDLLGRVTVQNIQYKRFQFDGSRVTLSGVARTYEDIAYQQKIFASNPLTIKYIRDFSFANFGVDQNGLITFSLAYTVDSALLSYVANSSDQ
ncbi:MAG: hypothetical protein COV08_00275 [Candidatus Vogelbacteria bacterium CG10_big_fil_rev_8_21_14_0_10_49_38]|uniref:PilN domain-containing protein n=1 Tax=Candidatus Vogelbacteria bacterium CG10_big_fil_rev_8_21_14_0_10_49_38 TaxID=1975043 RepID=A0A2H0RIP2_9BACT|nr:MAG: hypothetical protein BK006_00275 [bacterium CG10_49_38]PIR46358.1 MAG: hypothetical protein COV08_00275 [Candidatus Vogelbacteria bacterium CG10_big_fil_rev_8_21_14_0_10_49_38]